MADSSVKRQSKCREYYALDHAFQGVLVGCAVGDSLGLPAEGLSPARIRKLGWSNWRQRLLFGRGLISDDTEHTLFVAQALLRHPDCADRFQRALAGKLKWWLFSLPAGTGLATARAILKLWVGISPKNSGVYSAGNGPAMRSALIGVFFRNDPQKLYDYVKASTLITHTDPKALTGALAVARLSGYLARVHSELDHGVILDDLRSISASDKEWMKIVSLIEYGVEHQLSVMEFAHLLNLERGISGYIYHTVPVVIYSVLVHEVDFEESMINVLNCGGDADTTGAILGSILGSCGKRVNIPAAWVDDIAEWPRSIAMLERVAVQLNALESGRPHGEVSYFVPAIFLRNLFFLFIVLFHGFIRLLPAILVRRLFP